MVCLQEGNLSLHVSVVFLVKSTVSRQRSEKFTGALVTNKDTGQTYIFDFSLLNSSIFLRSRSAYIIIRFQILFIFLSILYSFLCTIRYLLTLLITQHWEFSKHLKIYGVWNKKNNYKIWSHWWIRELWNYPIQEILILWGISETFNERF